MKKINAFCSYSSILSQREYPGILKAFYKYNSNILLSLYDIKYYLMNEKKLLEDIFNGANSVFLDSGVYEVETSLNRGLANYKWNFILYLDTLKWVLSEFNLDNKVFIANFDTNNLSLNEQIETSIDTFNELDRDSNLKNAKYVFTIHSKYLKAEDLEASGIQDCISNFKKSAIIAMPEKELGTTLSDKINSIKILTSLGYPLHLLGCLDPTHLIIFALAGARNFDGLNWLKFYFNNKLSYYRNIYDVDLIKGSVVDSRSYIINNCIYIDKLVNNLEYSITTEDYSMFEEEQRILSGLA
jgi:hypothetical protein